MKRVITTGKAIATVLRESEVNEATLVRMARSVRRNRKATTTHRADAYSVDVTDDDPAKIE
ncbi:hypothetical protein E3O53_03320 [Cryobacterium sp. TMT2-18-3]|uniref:hypothetical protein n=1 Tax=unclassified Cryobacterium TaxID=2649013 RepID=UPI00106A0134|nr:MULTISPECIES: hypothetical protein [unclassified Cryobacterium]TFC30837.1 hypothetical protein E3O22_02825 [Cryobacterium sp. TMT2-18-2]TFC66478.1 hypothetical protein E3O53_03320 [Cryobacterium sp. TMT2-18-3]